MGYLCFDNTSLTLNVKAISLLIAQAKMNSCVLNHALVSGIRVREFKVTKVSTVCVCVCVCVCVWLLVFVCLCVEELGCVCVCV